MGFYDQPYPDPMRDRIEALELETERTVEGTGVFYEDPWRFEPGFSKTLTELEDSIEGTAIVPAVPEPLVPEPLPGPHLSELPGPSSPDPPVLEETGTRGCAGPPAAPAAVPLVARDGIGASTPRPRLGGSAGIKYNGPATEARWCPRDECDRDPEECADCPDHDVDSGECHYEGRTTGSEETGG